MNELDNKEISEIISVMTNCHLEIRKLINKDIEDKKHAIYLLQGGSLSSLIYAYDFNNQGYIAPLMQQYRMMLETAELIIYFDELKDNSRQIKTFFKGKTVKRKPGNSGNPTIEERIKLSGLTEEQLNREDELCEKLFNISSNYLHPTIESIRGDKGDNLLKNSYTFDYERSNIPKPYMSPALFNNLFLRPVIRGFLIPIKTLPLNKSYYLILFNFLDKYK